MRSKGHHIRVVETLRTADRQKWLYGIGRTHRLKDKPVTWTLNSIHLTGNAADVCCERTGYNAGDKFWDDLKTCATLYGCEIGPPPWDRGHVQLLY